jgi:hypothetical protein
MELKRKICTMNLTQFLRAYGVEQFSRWGCIFNSEEDAIKIFGCFPQETQPERFGSVILFDAFEDYDIYNKCVAKGAEPMSFGDWRSLLFLSCDQAQLAASRLREQLRTNAAGVAGNQLVFFSDLDEVAVYQAIASSEVEAVSNQVVVIPGILDEDWVFLGDFCWIPIPFKEDKFSPKPKILVCDLDAEEADIARTVWIDATQEPEGIVQMIAWWLGRSPIPDASHWRVIDTDEFPPRYIQAGYSDLYELSCVARMWEQHGDGFWVYYRENRFKKKAPPFESDRVRFLGCYGDANNFFQEQYQELFEEGEFEPNLEDFVEFCAFERDQYTILQWEGNTYIYSVDD